MDGIKGANIFHDSPGNWKFCEKKSMSMGDIMISHWFLDVILLDFILEILLDVIL